MSDLVDDEDFNLMSSFKHAPDFKSKEIAQEAIHMKQVDEEEQQASLSLEQLDLQKSDISNKLFHEGQKRQYEYNTQMTVG